MSVNYDKWGSFACLTIYGRIYQEEKMKKYVELELEVKNINTIDIITTSPFDIGQDTPGIGMDDDMLS